MVTNCVPGKLSIAPCQASRHQELAMGMIQIKEESNRSKLQLYGAWCSPFDNISDHFNKTWPSPSLSLAGSRTIIVETPQFKESL